MEYLSLQDIPHRYCDPMHPQRMSLSHPDERPLAHMAAAVSPTHPSSSSSFSSSRSLPLPYTRIPPGTQRQGGEIENARKGAWERLQRETIPAPPLTLIRLPILPQPAVVANRRVTLPEPSRVGAADRRVTLPEPSSTGTAHARLLKRKHDSSFSSVSLDPFGHEVSASHDTCVGSGAAEKIRSEPSQPSSEAETVTSDNKESPLTEDQQHHMRSSPPIQPGEQHHAAKLPSFSEVSGPHSLVNTTPVLTKCSSFTQHERRHRRALRLIGMGPWAIRLVQGLPLTRLPGTTITTSVDAPTPLETFSKPPPVPQTTI